MNTSKRIAEVSDEGAAKKTKLSNDSSSSSDNFTTSMLEEWFPDFEQPEEMALPPKEINNDKKPVSKNFPTGISNSYFNTYFYF